MANTYTLLASNTLGANASSVVFNGIPATYTDLIIKISARDTFDPGGGTKVSLQLQTNNSSGYSTLFLNASGATISNGKVSAGSTWISVAPYVGAGETANTYSNGEIYIANYATSSRKQVSSYSVSETNSAQAFIEIDAGYWNFTAAINSITLYPYVEFATNSSFWLYGIKNS